MPQVQTVKLDSGKLRAAIVARGLSRTQIAADAGVSASLLATAISGRAVSTLAARAIARALRTGFDGLVMNQSNAAVEAGATGAAA
jgi:transcriptional regulator with XRE-family HTH domain